MKNLSIVMPAKCSLVNIDYSSAVKPDEKWCMHVKIQNSGDVTGDLKLKLYDAETEGLLAQVTHRSVNVAEQCPSIWVEDGLYFKKENHYLLSCGHLENGEYIQDESFKFKVRLGSYTRKIFLADKEWWLWQTSSNKIIIMFFGGGATIDKTPYVWLNPLYRDDIEKTYSRQRENLVLNLQGAGFNVLSNATIFTYNSTSNWLKNTAEELAKLGYQVYLFGFSAGGVTVAYEIQKSYANIYKAAVVAAGILEWEEGKTEPIFHSVETAEKTNTNLLLISPTEDVNSYVPMKKYYEKAKNTSFNVELVEWEDGHDVFKHQSLNKKSLFQVV